MRGNLNSFLILPPTLSSSSHHSEVKKKDRSVNLNFAILAFFIFNGLLSWRKIDSPDEYYGFHKALLLRGHRDKPGQFQAGILHSYFIWAVYFITAHTPFTLIIQYATWCYLTYRQFCLNHLLVLCELFAVNHIRLLVLFSSLKHWSFCTVSCFGKLSEPISYHECVRTPAGHLLTLFPFAASLIGKLRPSVNVA